MKIPIVIAIDTSCDETSVAVVQGTTVLSNIVASQIQLHKQYGGVFPTVAKQAHIEQIDPCIKAALKQSHQQWEDIDAIAVTQGPGLAPALEVGINKAKELAIEYQKPLIAVNHMEGHLLSVLAKPKTNKPANIVKLGDRKVLSIIVSGGHTEFVLTNEIGQYQKIGQTLDDAAGEVLDKVGRMLDLGYPAGPVIEQFAKQGNYRKFAFPLPMTMTKNYDLSFSGLKTKARTMIETLDAENELDKQAIFDFCASFQYAVFRHICYKLNKILEDHIITEVWLGGGVAANTELRKMIRQTIGKTKQKITLITPYTKKLCGDNAAMIGIVANHKFTEHDFISDLNNLDRKPRWDI